ncbi:WD40/YVTN/BNR-like repeat-containing protein [Desulfosarcina ovata]|uniref:WD40/YVTN/BNR-like repeat-containing protein n=1 Tax=Desulfosarcina ovata TaxID=83564 RepID=UPI0012D30E69|nr:exo-alpha-sialidase [Desulfosarcina ovata]
MKRRVFIKIGTSFLLSMMFPLRLLAANSKVNAVDNFWASIPLSTGRMKELNMAGGDGFQYVHALAYAPSKPNIAYLSTDQSGVWRSTDGGKSWAPKFRGFFAYGARSIAVDPYNPETVIAAGFLGYDRQRGMKYPKRYQGIILTTDGGESWKMVRRTDFFKQVSKGDLILFQPPTNERGLQSRCLRVWCASASEGLLESRDGGESWHQTQCHDTEIHDMALSMDREGAILLASRKGLFRYLNDTMTPIGAGLPAPPRSIGNSPAAPQFVYAAMGKKGVAVSEDYGKSFRKLPSAYLWSTDITDIYVSPVNAKKIYIRADKSGQPPCSSDDGGYTWKKPGSIDPENVLGKPGFYFSSPFAPHPTKPETCLHVTNGRARIIRTENGGESWHFSGSGFTGARMVDIIFLAPGRMIFCLTDHGLWETRDNCLTFREVRTPRIDGAKSVSSASARGKHIVMGFGQWGKKGLLVSHNYGKSFSETSQLRDRFYFVCFHPTISELVYAGPFLSVNGGSTWRRMSQTARALSTDGKTLYAIWEATGKQCEILSSIDHGESYRPRVKLDIPERAILDIKITPRGVVLLATTRGVYRIEEQSAAHRDYRHGLRRDFFGTMYTQCINYAPDNPDLVFAGRRALGYGNGNGVFMSIDNGKIWREANFNLSPGMTVFSIKFDPFASFVYIGTSYGTYRMGYREKPQALI